MVNRQIARNIFCSVVGSVGNLKKTSLIWITVARRLTGITVLNEDHFNGSIIFYADINE